MTIKTRELTAIKRFLNKVYVTVLLVSLLIETMLTFFFMGEGTFSEVEGLAIITILSLLALIINKITFKNAIIELISGMFTVFCAIVLIRIIL